VKLKPAQEHWYRVAICLHEFGQHLVAPCLQILEIFWVIGAKPHQHSKVADLGGETRHSIFAKKVSSLQHYRKFILTKICNIFNAFRTVFIEICCAANHQDMLIFRITR